jgi:hypothetical protein
VSSRTWSLMRRRYGSTAYQASIQFPSHLYFTFRSAEQDHSCLKYSYNTKEDWRDLVDVIRVLLDAEMIPISVPFRAVY